MKIIGLLILLSASPLLAAKSSDSLSAFVPDSSFHFDRQEIQRVIRSRPRIEPDRMVVGNMKFFTRIVPVNPMIDPGMIKKIPKTGLSDSMRVVPLNPGGNFIHPR